MNNLPIETCESVVQQRDALAAENTAMKENIENVLSHWAAAEPGDMSWMMDKCMPSLRDSCIETPATDAFLHELMAKGVEEFSDNQMQKSLEQRAIGNPALSDIYNDNSMDAKVFASRLRKGINDAQ
ncbi:hypothetical protein [Hafnia paralvei]|uniref:hypothetical protein n=1 Tax=Hafnia paralvei TaxID=546367 RepID=UPI000BB56D88|nr:hypothetical protein [Hafnia paralvei]PNK67765.1 hypothetical protein A6J69_012275 [Hafnia paralvei]